MSHKHKMNKKDNYKNITKSLHVEKCREYINKNIDILKKELCLLKKGKWDN